MKKLWNVKGKKNTVINNNMKYYILNGILFTIMTSLYKSFADKFITRLGGGSFHLSLYNALPGLIGAFFMFPGIILISKTKNKKKTMSKFFLMSRFTIFSFAFVPFFPIKYRPTIFIMLFTLMSLPESLSVMSLQSFSGDIFPEEDRSTAISLRNKFSTLFNVIFLFILGEIFNIVAHNNEQAVILYQILFVLSFIIGLIEISTFMKLKEVNTIQMKEESLKDLKIQIPKILKNKNFSGFLFCSLIFHFGWQMGWPLFSIYQIKYLHANELWLTIINVSSNVVMFFCYSYWNKLIQKKGNAFVIMFATFGMAITPIFYALSYNLYILTLTGLITGFFTSGTLTVILSSLLEVCPEENRLLYVGIHATFTNLTLSIAPMVGNLVLSHTNIYIALCASGFFRLIGSIAFYIRKKYIKKNVNTSSMCC
ncbi:MFS transporter [Clostridium sp. KNHs214]|uniref:MFS transporter n=1 Tax=Clostridium sp. KNHs214 TaxID=1540257 RepID=UPI00054EC9E1|nr:MFS transporter [Clostridium sp. KNHs214]